MSADALPTGRVSPDPTWGLAAEDVGERVMTQMGFSERWGMWMVVALSGEAIFCGGGN